MSKIEDLKQAFALATPGQVIVSHGNCVYSKRTGKRYAICSVRNDMGEDERERTQNRRDAEFIALAHNLMPQLLARHEALEAIAARVNGEFDHPALLKIGALSTVENDIRTIIGGLK